MELLRTGVEVRAWRRADVGSRVAFVPTMGALHAGHLALVAHARTLAERVVASVFVNPTQFAPNEDFARYPRRPEEDAAALASVGCDALFLPPIGEIYPEGHATFVEPAGAALGLEGELRPRHFRGVATVVTQLFGLVRPDVAVFGQKDAQQLAVIRQVVRDLHLPVEIAGHPTVRESDGLAMSSRNAYLSAGERAAARVLFRALSAAGSAIESGERDANALRSLMFAVLTSEPLAQPQYAEVVDARTFRPLERAEGAIVLPIAARLGATRLLDNLSLFVDA
jgi:pantoate--beta-alanine ligase